MIKCSNYLRYFKDYTDSFLKEINDQDRFKIELKIVHTMNVLKVMRILAKNQNLKGEDYEIAKIIALFHDFGRFNQLKLYGHFNDRTSINHAEESVREMQRLNILDKANGEYVPEYKKELIYKAILNHNRDEIVGEADDMLILMSKLIRDADKIDIYRSIAKYIGMKTTEEYLSTMNGYSDSHEISDSVYEKIKNGVKLKRDDIKTIADDQIWEFYWVISDMNFPVSLKVIKDRKYLEEYFRVFTETGKFIYEGRAKELYDYIMKEFYDRVDKGVL